MGDEVERMTIIPATTNAMTYCYFLIKKNDCILIHTRYCTIQLTAILVCTYRTKKSDANNIKENHISMYLYLLNNFNVPWKRNIRYVDKYYCCDEIFCLFFNSTSLEGSTYSICFIYYTISVEHLFN